MHHYLTHFNQLIIYDEKSKINQTNLMEPLAYQDTFIRYLPEINKDNIGIIHIYPMTYPQNLLLGGKDVRLPKLEQALMFLKSKNYQSIIRPHGGLAIVNNPGIINFSLVTDSKGANFSIDAAYQQLVSLIAELFSHYDLTVEAYEVPNSYCPGKYDLVINGYKVGGTAQRRFKTGITTAAYLSLSGDQVQRAKLVREFYRYGGADSSYPQIDPSVMTTISDLLHYNYTEQHFRTDLLNLLQKYTHVITANYEDHKLKEMYKTHLKRMESRNQRLQ